MHQIGPDDGIHRAIEIGEEIPQREGGHDHEQQPGHAGSMSILAAGAERCHWRWAFRAQGLGSARARRSPSWRSRSEMYMPLAASTAMPTQVRRSGKSPNI